MGLELVARWWPRDMGARVGGTVSDRGGVNALGVGVARVGGGLVESSGGGVVGPGGVGGCGSRFLGRRRRWWARAVLWSGFVLSLCGMMVLTRGTVSGRGVVRALGVDGARVGE